MAAEKTTSLQQLELLIKARAPLFYLVSVEEARVENQLKALAKSRELRMEIWSFTEGFKNAAGVLTKPDMVDPLKTLDHVRDAEGQCLFVLRDFHPFLKDPKVIRKLRDLVDLLPRGSKKNLVILSPVLLVPPELERQISVIEWDLPSAEEVLVVARRILQLLPEASRQKIEEEAGLLDRAVDAALGLTEEEVAQVFAKSAVRTKTFDVDIIRAERDELLGPRDRLAGVRELKAECDALRRRVAGLESALRRGLELPAPPAKV